METIKKRTVTLFGIFILALVLAFPTDVFSQGPPPWAPAHGYKTKTRHIYFPNQNMYYDIKRGNYIYFSNGKWTFSKRVPSVFVGINLGKTTQIELNFYGDSPQHYNYSHKTKYKVKKHKKNHHHHKNHPGKGK